MAFLIENPNGRRMIRLSAQDVLAVVQSYQQQTAAQATPPAYTEAEQLFAHHPLHLPLDN
ncbi:MAG: hypothetical protein SFZ03_12170 [Candidatus Melainabacteria bacterium]|nr:hypothetical protein [Candidatus Melainabacteria bacterium]